MAWTNLGKQRMFEEFFCSGAIDDTFRFILCSSTGTWDSTTSSTRDVYVVSSAVNTNGIEGGTSGIIVLRDNQSDGLNFDVSSSTQLGLSATRAVLQATGEKEFGFSGAITGARYVIMVAAGSYGSPFDFSNVDNEIYAWWDIGANTNIAAGNTLTITSLALQGQ